MSALKHRTRMRSRQARSPMAWYHRSRRRAQEWCICPCGFEAWGPAGSDPGADHYCEEDER